MVLVHGSCHPTGENPEYDGLYLRADEMPDFAASLRGKPIHVEHNTEVPVGKVVCAWVTKDHALDVMFETDDHSFPGHFAANLVKKGLCGELSLGHECQIAHSANGAMRVVGKTPSEVSIVVKGARDQTTISAWGRNSSVPVPVPDLPPGQMHTEKKKEYIRRSEPRADSTMTDQAPTTTAAEETPVPETPSETPETPAAQQQASVMSELKQQSAMNSQMAAKLSELQNQLSEYQQVGQKRRQETLEGTVKDWVQKILETHKQELGQFEGKYKEMFEAMTKNEEAEPMVQLLSCAARRSANSTAQAEKKYQNSQQENKRLRTQLEAAKPALAQVRERFAPPAEPAAPKTDAYSRMFSAPVEQRTRNLGGLRAANPDMYGSLMSKASSMPSGGSKQSFDTSLYSSEAKSKLGW